jgi:predicted glycoside hydrolase/deacetylase ChbG (UPF0249 family)
MKMIIRADDVGYTDVFNIGTFEAIEKGVVTSADVMFDTPGTIDALNRLKELPWISVGWHAHFWGAPVLDAKKVPSLIDYSTLRFKKDLRNLDTITYQDIYEECRAEIELCIRILGRSPDTAEFNDSIAGSAMKAICNEYGIAYCFAHKTHTPKGKPTTIAVPDPKWAERRIHVLDPMPAYDALYTDSVTQVESYEPADYYINDICRLSDYDESDIVEQSWHPGYLDYYVWREGDSGLYARNFTLGRIKDVEALCSERLKSWIKKKNIELVNFRDALYGTTEYQNHLKVAESELAVF